VILIALLSLSFGAWYRGANNCQIICNQDRISFYQLFLSLLLHNCTLYSWPKVAFDSYSLQVVKMAQRLGIIIFGATGYTGKIVVEKIVSLAQKKNLSWGVAGRSKAKLQKVLDEVSKEQGLLINGYLINKYLKL
jgi:hypothetical protein